MTPETRYAQSGNASIAYRTLGEGPPHLVLVSGWLSQVEHWWEEPSVRRFFERLASFGQLISYDRRGSGLSERVGTPPPLEDEVDDLIAVLNEAGARKAVLLGYAQGAPLCVLTAIRRPERVERLVVYAGMMRASHDVDYEWALTPDARAELLENFRASWGSGNQIDLIAPSRADDPQFRQWLARLERLSVSPGTMMAMANASADLDVRHLLPELRLPALVIHRTDDRLIDVRHSRYAADRIPGARYVELPGIDNMISVGDSGAIVDEIEEFVTGWRGGAEPPRALRTVIFTDIVDSTGRASEVGDVAWRDLLHTHGTLVSREVARYGGEVIKNVGDGYLITFEGRPSNALRCAIAMRDAVDDSALRMRVGMHTGECELIDDDVGGMAVHIAARVNALAEAGEILVSGTVYGTVVGSGIPFVWRGQQTLRGVPGTWPTFAVA